MFFLFYSSRDCVLDVTHKKSEPDPKSKVPIMSVDTTKPPPIFSATESIQIDVASAHLRCMIDDTSGVLVSSSGHDPPKVCYFELEDLNIERPVDLLDVVMILNRMRDVNIQFQARLINDKNKISYVAHLNGVQINGHLPSYMSHIKLKRADKSIIQAGIKSDKVQRYRKAEEVFDQGKFKSVSDLLAVGRIRKDHIRAQGTIKTILNENFGIIEGPIDSDQQKKELALFDTFDLYLADNETAADAKKSVDAVLKVGYKVTYNACFIEADMPITYLATSLWVTSNAKIGKPEVSLTKDQIQEDKLKIFHTVSKSCASIVKTLKDKKYQNSGPKTGPETRKSQIEDVYKAEAYR
jgi:hypothetical protein